MEEDEGIAASNAESETRSDQDPAPDAGDPALDTVLVEDVSIDGMCGVY